MAEQISSRERRSVAAERETLDRFTAAFLEDKAGAVLPGRISSVTRFGVFVILTETGADGLLPIKRMPNDFYDVFEDRHCLSGRSTGYTFSVGDPITIRLIEANKMTGGLIFDFVDHTPLGEKALTDVPRRKKNKRIRRHTRSRPKRRI